MQHNVLDLELPASLHNHQWIRRGLDVVISRLGWSARHPQWVEDLQDLLLINNWFRLYSPKTVSR
jgi:hypothetical protein